MLHRARLPVATPPGPAAHPAWCRRALQPVFSGTTSTGSVDLCITALAVAVSMAELLVWVARAHDAVLGRVPGLARMQTWMITRGRGL